MRNNKTRKWMSSKRQLLYGKRKYSGIEKAESVEI